MRFLLSAFLMTSIVISDQSNSWRGITPLHSTCEDVKKILKVDTCSLPTSEYTLADYRVKVSFANEDCDKSSSAWRVPKGTVLSLVITPKQAMSVSQFGADISQFKKRQREEIVGMEHYDNDEQGVSVELFQGYVTNVVIGPRKTDDALRCTPTSKATHEQTNPTCCDREASDAIKQAWLKFTADGRYRLAVRSDMKWREPKARAFAYAWSSLGYDRHESGYYHLAAIVVDKQSDTANGFALVVFSAPKSGDGSYRPYFVFRNRDLSNSHLAEYLGLLDLVIENEHGSKVRCSIQWDPKNTNYVCRA